MKTTLLTLILLFSSHLLAFEQTTKNTDPVIVYSSDENFEDTIEYIRSGIADAGLKITSDLHIGDMLDATAKDTGFAKIYQHAMALEFCSISMAHAMATAHPANMSACPLTLNIYQLPESEVVYVAFKRPSLLGDGEKAANRVVVLMDEIVRSALD